MANLIITYDLRNQRDYKTLIDAIKSYGTYVKLFDRFGIFIQEHIRPSNVGIICFNL